MTRGMNNTQKELDAQIGATGTAMSPGETRTRVRTIALVALTVNLSLSALKLLVGLVGNSQAVVADAVHSFSDVLTDIAILFGVHYWSAPPDREHPYGHGRIETMITTVIGLVLATAALSIGYHAVLSVVQPRTCCPSWIALVGAVISIVGKEALYRWTMTIGRRLNSSAVMANAWHHRADALSSIPVAIAVVVAMLRPEWSFVDPIGALIVSVIILHVAWTIVRPSLARLADKGVATHIEEDIRQAALRIDRVRAVHAIRTRHMGPSIHVDLHVLVAEDMTVREGHEISEHVKRALLDDGPNVIDVVVHLEPHAE